MALSDTACKQAKPRAKPYKTSDGGGLFLLVQPNGSKLWRMAYRYAGKQKTLAFGVYPQVSLSEARKRREKAKTLLSKGFDPSVDSDDGRPTFELVAKEWYAGRAGNWAKSHSSRVWAAIERDLLPVLGDKLMFEIEPLDVLQVLRNVETRGAIETAHRTKQYAGSIFRYGVATGRAARDPTADLRGALRPAPRARHHARIEVEEVPEFFVNLLRYDGEAQTRLAIEFLMHTAVRTGELIYAQKREFKVSEASPRWRIPADRMKKGREHHVPLTAPAREILDRLVYLSGDSPYLLPGARSKTISNNTMLFALYRMGYKGRATMHGMRGLASTVLNESGLWESDWIERQLAHDDDDKVRSAYNAAQYWSQRVEMMTWWSDWLEDKKSISMLLG